MIEATYQADLPYQIPEPLSSPINPFAEPTEIVVAAVIEPNYPSDSLLDIPQQPIIPRTPQGETQGADPSETQEEVTARLAGTPVVCRLPWIAKKWSRCHD